jgi:hypothetical protein
VIDVGAAEGYYAVGCALRLPSAQVYAFDTEPLARDLCRGLAGLNGVSERVHISGLCTPAHLAELAPALIISDCEGGELELLDPARVPALARCALLVELHDFIDPRISATLTARFEPTHTCEIARSSARMPSDYAALTGLEPKLAALALEESRPTVMEWAYLVPRP